MDWAGLWAMMVNWRTTVPLWLKAGSAVVQAGTAIIQVILAALLVLIAFMNARISAKLVHAPHQAHPKPVSVNIGESLTEWIIKLRNFGPGAAFGIRVKTLVTSRKMDLDALDPMKVWVDTDLLPGKGPFELLPGETANYQFTGFIKFDNPFLVSWRTVTGKRYQSGWFAHGDRHDEFIPLGRNDKLRFWVGWVSMNLKNPFTRLVKRWRQFKATRKK